MPKQLESKDILHFAAHPQNIVQILLNDYLTNAPMLKWRSIVTKNLSCLAMRPVVEHDDIGVRLDFKRALDLGNVEALDKEVRISTTS